MRIPLLAALLLSAAGCGGGGGGGSVLPPTRNSENQGRPISRPSARRASAASRTW